MEQPCLLFCNVGSDSEPAEKHWMGFVGAAASYCYPGKGEIVKSDKVKT